PGRAQPARLTEPSASYRPAVTTRPAGSNSRNCGSPGRPVGDIRAVLGVHAENDGLRAPIRLDIPKTSRRGRVRGSGDSGRAHAGCSALTDTTSITHGWAEQLLFVPPGRGYPFATCAAGVPRGGRNTSERAEVLVQ